MFLVPVPVLLLSSSRCLGQNNTRIPSHSEWKNLLLRSYRLREAIDWVVKYKMRCTYAVVMVHVTVIGRFGDACKNGNLHFSVVHREYASEPIHITGVWFTKNSRPDTCIGDLTLVAVRRRR